MTHAEAVVVAVRQPTRLVLLACFLQRICSCGGFTSSGLCARESATSTSSPSRGSSGSNAGTDCALQPRWIHHHHHNSAFRQKRQSWIFARGGGGTGRPPPLAGVADSGAEATPSTSPASAANTATADAALAATAAAAAAAAAEPEKLGVKKESAHLKLRSVGKNTGAAAAAAAAAATAPWKWIVVDERQAATAGEKEQEQEQEQGEKEGSASISGERFATEIVPQVAVEAAQNTAKIRSTGGSGGGGSGGVDDNLGGGRDNDGDGHTDHPDGSAAEAEEGRQEVRDELPPGTATLIEYRAPPAAGGEEGETLYASLGDDVSKFIVFLESAVARGESIRESSGIDAGEVGLELPVGAGGGAGAAAGTERHIFVSTVEIGDQGVGRRLEALWAEGKLLSQERDAVNALRGQEKSFSELLLSYTNRTKFNHWEEIPPERLLDTLKDGCGPDSSSLCGYNPARPPDETLSSIKTLLEWFRQDFPYYYDGCHSCANRDNNTFVGYVRPTEDEREFRAGRTEVYHCSSCGRVSRFARYVAVSKVLETRRGRCGEYSVLVMRMLEALGYACRWVVDWSDHVWVEARVGGRWVHVDPCEAAVDEPLLYESWGKKQTYILAFTPDAVVDVTEHYTSDFDAAKARRDVDPDTLAKLLAEATKRLQEP